MALYSLRLRRTLSAISALHRHAPSTPAASSQISHSIFCPSAPSLSKPSVMISPYWPLRSSSMAFSSRSSFGSNNEDDKIGPDTILFEGCDYNHWLITMEFPKDPKPTPEEMVRTYEETCAKGLNISVEEAKAKMYACSTTTYQGFQAIMTEEESEKFRGLPGVVFILPDSYIDPVNKEYGGDKYINGTIIPRPPPVQYGRQTGRYRDRNNTRNPDQPRFDRGNPDQPRFDRGNPDQPRFDRGNRPPPNWQGNPSYSQQGSMQGDGRNFEASQNYMPQGPPRNDGPPGSGERRDSSPMNNYAPNGRDLNQGGRGPMPSYQGNINQSGPGERRDPSPMNNYAPNGRDLNQGGRGPMPSYQGNINQSGPGERRDPSPMNNYAPNGRDSYQGGRSGPVPSYQGNYNQSGQGSYNPDVKPNYHPQGEQRDFVPPSGQGSAGAGFNPAQSGTAYAQGGYPGHGAGTPHSQGQSHAPYPGSNEGRLNEGQRFPQGDRRNMQGELQNYTSGGQTWNDQGRF